MRPNILFEKKCIGEDARVGDVRNSVWHQVVKVTAYACVLSDRFSLQEDMELKLYVLSDLVHVEGLMRLGEKHFRIVVNHLLSD